jgi:hypothetical protein
MTVTSSMTQEDSRWTCLSTPYPRASSARDPVGRSSGADPGCCRDRGVEPQDWHQQIVVQGCSERDGGRRHVAAGFIGWVDWLTIPDKTFLLPS